MATFRLGIVEDDETVRESLQEYLGADPEIDVACTAESVEEFLSELPAVGYVDLVLLDLGLPGMSGLEGIEAIHEELPDSEIIILTAKEDYDLIYAALCAGAISYLTKRTPLPVVKEALLIVHQGGAYMSPEIAMKVISQNFPRRGNHPSILTDRQSDIVQGLVDGLSYKLIAGKYNISVETVRDHIKKIYKKLQVNSKTEVIRKRMDGEI